MNQPYSLGSGDVARLLQNTEGKVRLAAALTLLGGLRIGEVCDLRHRDVVVGAENATIYIGGMRTVAASGQLRDLLAERQGAPDDLVIGWTCATLRRMLQRAMLSQGIKASVHSLRHTGVASMVAGE